MYMQRLVWRGGGICDSDFDPATLHMNGKGRVQSYASLFTKQTPTDQGSREAKSSDQASFKG